MFSLSVKLESVFTVNNPRLVAIAVSDICYGKRMAFFCPVPIESAIFLPVADTTDIISFDGYVKIGTRLSGITISHTMLVSRKEPLLHESNITTKHTGSAYSDKNNYDLCF